MEYFFEQIYQLLTTPPGNLAYYVVLAFSIFGALQGAIHFWRSTPNSEGLRMVIGLSLLLIVELVLFASTALAWQGVVSYHTLLPIIDRSVMLISVVLIIWLWAFPDQVRLADAITALFIISIVVFSGFSMLWWLEQDPQMYFNGTWPDVISETIALGMLLAGCIILFIRRPSGWGFGLGMLGLLFGGHLIHWMAPMHEGDYAGAVRLAEMAAYPLLLALPYRLPIVEKKPQLAEDSAVGVEFKSGADVRILRALLDISYEDEPEKFYQRIAGTISHLMVADICLLVIPPDEGDQLIVPTGYNLILDREIEGFSLDAENTPVLANALRRSRDVRLPASSSSRDLQSLSQSLRLKDVGSMLCVPIVPRDDSVIMGIVLLTPYSDRSWTEADETELADISEPMADILQRIQQVAVLQVELDKTRETLEAIQLDIEQTQRENKELNTQLEASEEQLSKEQSRVENLAAIIADQEIYPGAIATLGAVAIGSSQDIVSRQDKVPSEDAEGLEAELRLALEEIAHLRAALTNADKQYLKAKDQPGDRTPAEISKDDITTIAHELRQPMASIMGYTDLLLGESVGIIGAMQRKFLERIKVSSERIGGLIDELTQITLLEKSELSLTTEAVDLNTIIDEAVTSTIPQLSEKDIVLRVDLPEQLPEIQADRDAVQQVLINLLQNAGSATPVEGEISLHARLETKEHEPSYVLMQVSDSGGGITSEDMPRVFSRLYRADNTSIPGVGDTGVGLSVVKTLVEALGGRIWVDAEMGRGSTFSVLLPLGTNSSNGDGSDW
jgi:signal transduction histidine kinase